jgi:hypothetical protein
MFCGPRVSTGPRAGTPSRPTIPWRPPNPSLSRSATATSSSCAPARWRDVGHRGGASAGGDAPELSFSTIPRLARRRIAAVATDPSGVEVRPNELPDSFQPLHIVAIAYMGLSLGDMFDLERLATRRRLVRDARLGPYVAGHRECRRPAGPGRRPLTNPRRPEDQYPPALRRASRRTTSYLRLTSKFSFEYNGHPGDGSPSRVTGEEIG